MTWAWQGNYVTLSTGQRIRYAFFSKPDSDIYFVRCRSKDGRYARISTGQSKKVQAIGAAHRLILEDYQQIAPTSKSVTWDVAKERLTAAMTADGKRPRTIGGYIETLDKLIAMFRLAKGPADVTDRMAGEFKEKYAGGRFTRKRNVPEGDVANTQARKAKSLDSRIRTLKAAFGWFQKLRIVDSNPFEDVTAPEMDRHEVKYVKQGDLAEFFRWMEGRFPGWQMPHLFFEVKATTACRLEDICNLRSDQLEEGRLIFTACPFVCQFSAPAEAGVVSFEGPSGGTVPVKKA